MRTCHVSLNGHASSLRRASCVKDRPVSSQFTRQLVYGFDDRPAEFVGAAPRVQIPVAFDDGVAALPERCDQLLLLEVEQLRL
jgi:hypothetical protein